MGLFYLAKQKIKYKTEVRTAMLGGQEIRVEHLTPVLSAMERKERKKEIEECLFSVFVKYVGKSDN